MGSHKMKSLAFVHAPDEMRAPYEHTLESLYDSIRWCEHLSEIGSSDTLRAIVIDVDPIATPLRTTLEKLKATYPAAHLIGLSSQDSAQVALTCLRAGFSDFLLKPVSPEELAWSLGKVQHHQEVVDQIRDPRAAILKAVTQISTSSNPQLVRLSTIEALMQLLQSHGAAWIRHEKGIVKLLATAPADRKKQVPVSARQLKGLGKTSPTLLKSKSDRKVLLPCGTQKLEGILLWGIPARVTRSRLSQATLLLHHGETSLQNLQKYEEIKQQTFVDELTGLYNARYLKFALTKSIMKTRKPDQKFSVLFIDVDRFKSINDNHGHLAGSEFLIIIGKTIKNAVRSIDAVFRYGGDEFVVILDGTALEGAKEIGERIRRNIERRVFLIQELKLQTTVSIGIATYPDHASDRDALLKLADQAMYSAKKKSRNAVHLAEDVEATA